MATAAKPANNKFLTFIFVLSLMRDVMIVFVHTTFICSYVDFRVEKSHLKDGGPIVL